MERSQPLIVISATTPLSNKLVMNAFGDVLFSMLVR